MYNPVFPLVTWYEYGAAIEADHPEYLVRWPNGTALVWSDGSDAGGDHVGDFGVEGFRDAWVRGMADAVSDGADADLDVLERLLHEGVVELLRQPRERAARGHGQDVLHPLRLVLDHLVHADPVGDVVVVAHDGQLLVADHLALLPRGLRLLLHHHHESVFSLS